MYAYGTLRTYLEDAASDRSAPGGGSVAACAGALGASMGCMAARFTVGRKKFADVEEEVARHLAACVEAKDELLRLMDEDVGAYGAVAAAFRMPRKSAEQKAARREAIQRALVTAMAPPLAVMRICRRVTPALDRLAEVANPNLISDVGVAVLLVEASLRAARLNVEINLASLDDEELVARTREEVEAAETEVREAAGRIVQKVNNSIGGGS